MRYLKLFESYIKEEQVDIWGREVFTKFDKIHKDISKKKIEIPGGEVWRAHNQPQDIKLGYGYYYQKFLNLYNENRTPDAFINSLKKSYDRISEIRNLLKDSWDNIQTQKATDEEYELLRELRGLIDLTSDIHYVYTSLHNKDIDIDDDINNLILDVAEDMNMQYGLTYVDINRGIELQYIMYGQNYEPYINWQIVRRQQTTRGHINFRKVGTEHREAHGNADNFTKINNALESRLEDYFTSVFIRPGGGEGVTINLCNQKEK